MSKYITEAERYKIETMLEDGKTPKEIALRLGKHYTTIYREIKKGTVMLLNGSTWLEYPKYCADTGQRIKEERKHNKGVACKISDKVWLDRASYYIKELHYSPYAALITLRKEFPDITICKVTLYSYIYKNRLSVKRSDLPYHKSPRKASEMPRRPSLHMLGAKTIEERPKTIYARDIFGHWEMDTVVGSTKKSRCCLLVLSERFTRKEIIRKIPDKKAESVVTALNDLEHEFGTKNFKRVFKTITCDNGVEFSDFEGIEKSVNGIDTRTNVYFCHPYCSSERSTNENQNKLIRRYIPKGSIIDNYSKEFVQQVEDFLNNYPRLMFGGLSANEIMKRVTIP